MNETKIGKIVFGPTSTSNVSIENDHWHGGLHRYSLKEGSQTVRIKPDGSVEPVVLPNIGTIVMYHDEDGMRPAIVMASHDDNTADLNVFGLGSVYYRPKSVFSTERKLGCWSFI